MPMENWKIFRFFSLCSLRNNQITIGHEKCIGIPLECNRLHFDWMVNKNDDPLELLFKRKMEKDPENDEILININETFFVYSNQRNFGIQKVEK